MAGKASRIKATRKQLRTEKLRSSRSVIDPSGAADRNFGYGWKSIPAFRTNRTFAAPSHKGPTDTP